jgi:hypothetical protein
MDESVVNAAVNVVEGVEAIAAHEAAAGADLVAASGMASLATAATMAAGVANHLDGPNGTWSHSVTVSLGTLGKSAAGVAVRRVHDAGQHISSAWHVFAGSGQSPAAPHPPKAVMVDPDPH